MNTDFPTSNPELNAVLHEFVKSVQEILKDNFVSAYLQGSFAIGDWDNDSDVDFTIVIENDISDTDLQALQIMHARIYNLESEWAKHLEGSYFPKNIIKSGNYANKGLWYLDNTFKGLWYLDNTFKGLWYLDNTFKGLWYLNNTFDKLALSNHDNTLVIRWVVREHGITLAGIPAKELIDFVPADDLRKEILSTMREWGNEIISGQWKMENKWAQPFVVLMYCRMLHSLNIGRIASKLSGAQWAKNTLDNRWTGLIQRAWDERPNPSLKVHQPAEASEVENTIEFVRFALELG